MIHLENWFAQQMHLHQLLLITFMCSLVVLLFLLSLI
jgi:hypothetical protein